MRLCPPASTSDFNEPHFVLPYPILQQDANQLDLEAYLPHRITEVSSVDANGDFSLIPSHAEPDLLAFQKNFSTSPTAVRCKGPGVDIDVANPVTWVDCDDESTTASPVSDTPSLFASEPASPTTDHSDIDVEVSDSMSFGDKRKISLDDHTTNVEQPPLDPSSRRVSLYGGLPRQRSSGSLSPTVAPFQNEDLNAARKHAATVVRFRASFAYTRPNSTKYLSGLRPLALPTRLAQRENHVFAYSTVPEPGNNEQAARISPHKQNRNHATSNVRRKYSTGPPPSIPLPPLPTTTAQQTPPSEESGSLTLFEMVTNLRASVRRIEELRETRRRLIEDMV